MRIVQIDASPYFCGGVTIGDKDNTIIDVPPLLRWSRGKDIGVLVGWLERKRWLRSWEVSKILKIKKERKR